LNRALAGNEFCARHNHRITGGALAAAGIGGALGRVILPGPLGLFVGGLIGPIIRMLWKGQEMSKKRVFISFDFDNDRALKDFVIGQSRLPASPFDVIDHSLKEAAPERDWKQKAKAAISRADIVLVIAGEHAYCARGVLAEIEMAREEGIPIVQMIGYQDRNCPAVPKAGRLYAWNWENLKNLLS
jgi:hypothetical protein